jgi:hypothetical protein
MQYKAQAGSVVQLQKWPFWTAIAASAVMGYEKMHAEVRHAGACKEPPCHPQKPY